VGLTVNEVDKTEDEQTKRVCEVYRTFLDAAYDVLHGKKTNEIGRRHPLTHQFSREVLQLK
jgi:hypothetical protein